MLRTILVIIIAVSLATAPVGAVTTLGTPTQNNHLDSQSLAAASQQNPDPAPRMDIDAPDQVTVGETFTLTVQAENNGGDAGEFSTITISSPSFSSSTGGERFQNPQSSLDYVTVRSHGDDIYDTDGNQITADYALVEAGTSGGQTWESGSAHQLTTEITAQEPGTLTFYVRTTLTDDENTVRKFTAPATGDTIDQQGFEVQRITVEVQPETKITANINHFGAESGTYVPGDIVQATATVTNTGNQAHRFYVGYSLRGPSGDYYSNSGSTHVAVSLDPGESEQVLLEWRVPDDAPQGNYIAETAVWKREDGGKLYGRLDGQRANADIHVTQATPKAEIKSIEEPTANSVSPGETVETSVVVENTGQLDHQFWVDVSVRTPDGIWITGEGANIQLESGRSQEVTLEIHLPNDAPEGPYQVGTAVYRSKSKDQRFDTAATGDAFTVKQIDRTPRAQIEEAHFASGQYDPSDRVTSTVSVRNTGEISHNFIVGYSVIGPKGNIYDNDASSHQELEIDPGEVRSVQLSLTLPSDAPPGDYDAVSSVWKRKTTDGLTGRLDTARKSSAFSVIKGDVAIESIDISPRSPKVGDKVSIEIAVSNDGGADINDATVIATIGGIQVRDTVDIAAESSTTVEFEVPAEQAGEKSITVRIATESQRLQKETRISVTKKTATVSGRITDIDGDPISDATVVFEGTKTEVETDSTGSFSIADIPVSVETIRIETANKVYKREVTLSPDQTNFVEYSLGSTGQLSLAERPDGYTVGQTFSVTFSVHNTGDQPGRYVVRLPDVQGLDFEGEQKHTLGISAGEKRQITVRATPTQEYQGDPIIAKLHGPQGTPIDTQEFSLKQAKTFVVVTAIDSNGKPVQGVEVGFLGGKSHKTSENGVARLEVSASSDARNTLQRYIEYYAAEYDYSTVEKIAISRGETNEIIVQLPANGKVSGHVRSNGHGIEDVTVIVGDRQVRTVEDGYFKFPDPIAPGSYYVRVKKNDQVILRQVVNIHKGSNQFELTVSRSRYESATGLNPYVRGVVNNIFGTGADKVQGEIYGQISPDDSVSIEGGSFFTTESGAYYTTGPCAWYSTKQRCESSGLKATGDEGSARALAEGSITGFIYGGEEMIKSFQELLRPIQYVQKLYEVVVAVLNDLGLLEDMLAAMPQQIKEAQQDDNPYTPGSEAYNNFAAGWYGGYASFILASTVVSAGVASGASKVVSSTSKFNKVMDKVKSMSSTTKQRQLREAVNSLDRSDSELSATLKTFDSDTETQIQRLHKQGELKTDTIKELAKVKRTSDFDAKEMEALINLYRFRYTREYIDSDITGDDLVKLARQGTPSETKVVVKRDGKLYWLEEGLTEGEAEEMSGKNGAVGWKHIVEKHDDEFYDQPGIENKEDILKVVHRTLKRGEKVEGESMYRYERDDGRPIVVIVSDNGFVITARPDSDSASHLGGWGSFTTGAKAPA